MSKPRRTETAGVDTLREDAAALLHATSDVASEKVAEARERLTGALERSREVYENAKERALNGAKAGDKFIRGNPYATAAIALGIGALIGLMLTRRNRD